MIAEGLDYKKHYAAFEGTPIDVLESESRKLISQAYELKRSCRHPEKHLQWIGQGRVDLFYCGTCGVSFTHDARDRSQDFFDLIKRRMKESKDK